MDKTEMRQASEFIIGGYTDPKDSRIGFGSLLLGFYDERKKLQYAGNVGIGFRDKTVDEMLITITPPNRVIELGTQVEI